MKDILATVGAIHLFVVLLQIIASGVIGYQGRPARDGYWQVPYCFGIGVGGHLSTECGGDA